jgi:hypothetical protein
MICDVRSLRRTRSRPYVPLVSLRRESRLGSSFYSPLLLCPFLPFLSSPSLDKMRSVQVYMYP